MRPPFPLRAFVWIAFSVTLLVPSGAHAAEHVDMFGGAGSLAEFWGPAGLGIHLLIRFLKDPRVAERIGRLIPKTWGPPVVAIVLGQAAAGLLMWRTGVDWRVAVMAGVFAGGEAILVHVLAIDVVRKGAEVAWPKDEPTPEPPKNPPPGSGLRDAPTPTVEVAGGPLPPLARSMLCFAFVFALACSPSDIVRGTTVANFAARQINAAEPVLTKKCTAGMDKVKTAEAFDKLEAWCDPAFGTWESARLAHVGLEAALQLAASGDVARLPGAIIAMTGAGLKLAQTMGALK